jgi:hypothetical protein
LHCRISSSWVSSPTDDDRRAAAAGVSAEANTWRWQFEDSLAASEALTTILEYERGLAASRSALAKLEAAKTQLDAEHNDLLVQRGPAIGITKLEQRLEGRNQEDRNRLVPHPESSNAVGAAIFKPEFGAARGF